MKLFKLFIKDENGGGMVEYILIVVLIALAATVGATTLGGKISTKFDSISGKIG